MALTARFIGLDDVVEQYEKTAVPFFSMWCKSMMICQYNGSSIEEGIELITEEIERNIKRQFPNECFLKIHPAHEKLYTLKSPVVYNVVFKSYEDTGLSLMSGNGNNAALINALNGMSSRMAAIEESLNGNDDDDDDEQQPANDGINGIIGQVNQLLEHPLISKIVDRFFSTPAPAPGIPKKQRAAFAGVTEKHGAKKAVVDYDKMPVEKQQALLTQCIEQLLQKGVTLANFVEMAKMPEEKIKMLLTLL